jgi:hypothetical protein
MKNRFTQGEWHAKDGQIYSLETGKTHAVIPYFDQNNEEQKANQNLIAVAPELLEAIEKISNELAFGNYQGNRVNDMLNLANSVIRKAQGE